MKTLNIDPQKYTLAEIDLIISALKSGLVLVLPTDTVYGLIADASNEKAVEKIFKIKKRPTEMKLPVFIGSIDLADKLAEINNKQKKELEEKWPGSYTFILPRKKYDRELFGLDSRTIALRIPDYPPLQEVLEKIKIPLVQTSANISGKGATGNIKEVIQQFESNEVRPDIVFDAGNLPGAKPSTIVDLTDQGKVLRK